MGPDQPRRLALVVGEELIGTPVPYAVPRATSAKIIADVAEVLVRLGRVDEGIHHLARAVLAIGTAPRDVRYAGALSSICEAATSIELYEFADECYRNAMAAVAPGLSVTLSMGLAPFEPPMTGAQIYDRADASLYSAKRGGRNRLGRDKVR